MTTYALRTFGGPLSLTPSPSAILALTTYQTNSVSSVLSTANKLSVTHGVDNTNVTQLYTLIGTSTGWGEVCSQGSASAWAASGAIGSPTGRGWFLDSSVLSLDGQTILAGNYTGNTRLSTGHTDGTQTGTIGSCEIHLRWYKYHVISGVYTLIAELALTGQTINSVITTFALPSVAGAATPLTSNEVLYQDLWVNIGTNTFGDAALNIRLNRQSTNSTGDTNTQLVTPGYSATSLPSSLQQTLDTFITLDNWVSLAASDGTCATRSDLTNSQNCQTGYFQTGSYTNTNALALNGGLVGHADVLSGLKKGWQIHSKQSFPIPGIFAARLDVTGDTGGDDTYEKVVKSFFLFNDPGDGSAYWYSDFSFCLEQDNPVLDSFPGQTTPAVLNTIIYAGSGSGFPSTQLNPLSLDSSLFGDFITCIFKVEQVSSGGGNTTWKTTYQLVNLRGQTITTGSTTTTHSSTITSLQAWFDEHWVDPAGGQQTNYNWQRYDVRWFYYSGDTTDRTAYTLGDTMLTGSGQHVSVDLIGSGFAPIPGLAGILGEVALDVQSGTSTSVAVLDIYQRSTQLTTLALADYVYAFSLLSGGVIVTDTAVNIDQVGGVSVGAANLPVNIVQYGSQTAMMGGSDAQTATHVPLLLIGSYNGSTVDQARSGLSHGVSTGIIRTAPYLYNGVSDDMWVNNQDNLTALAFGSVSSNSQSADITNYNHRGILIYIKTGTFGSGATSIVVTLKGKDPVSTTYYTILASASLSASQTITTAANLLRVYPGLTAVANQTASDVLPRTWRIEWSASAWGTGGSQLGIAYALIL